MIAALISAFPDSTEYCFGSKSTDHFDLLYLFDCLQPIDYPSVLLSVYVLRIIPLIRYEPRSFFNIWSYSSLVAETDLVWDDLTAIYLFLIF